MERSFCETSGAYMRYSGEKSVNRKGEVRVARMIAQICKEAGIFVWYFGILTPSLETSRYGSSMPRLREGYYLL